MIKYAEIYKIKIEETAKYVLKDCVISSYFDMTEMEG